MKQKLIIEKSSTKTETTIKLKGRLDAYWAEELSTTLDADIRNGHYHFTFDLKDVVYISSAGLRIFVMYYKKIQEINGSLYFSKVSENVESVLEMAGMKNIFTKKQSVKKPDHPKPGNRIVEQGIIYEFELNSNIPELLVQMNGDPDSVFNDNYQPQKFYNEKYHGRKFGLGLGAFGENNQEIIERCGEFIGFGNALAYQPTDGTNIPDYFIKKGHHIPEIKSVYSLSFEGQFMGSVQFATSVEKNAVPLSELLNWLLNKTGVQSAGVVILAEIRGLVCASLKQSPLIKPYKELFYKFPDIRDHFHITTEPEFNGMLTLITGVVTKQRDSKFSKFTRSLGSNTGLWGHFHAAVFSYSPLKRGEKDIHKLVATLFDQSRLKDVVHLLNDDRELNGIGESEFKHGICWIGKI